MIDADEVWGCEEEERKGKGKRGRKDEREETEEAKVNERKTQIRRDSGTVPSEDERGGL